MVVTLPLLDPILLEIGPLSIRWYGVAYLASFLLAWHLALSRRHTVDLSKDQIADCIFYVALGVILGGRLGYALFYESSLLTRPLELMMFWLPGRSFHGGLLGVVLALVLFARKTTLPLHRVGDFVAPFIPIGLGFGRLGNFMNQELWGRVAIDAPFAVIYPYLDTMPRHPSQLYEALLEGLVLFLILWAASKKPKPPWFVTGLFFAGYGVARFVCEWFRVPDSQLGLFVFDSLSMGQLLSIPMIFIGLGLIFIKRTPL